MFTIVITILQTKKQTLREEGAVQANVFLAVSKKVGIQTKFLELQQLCS